MSAVNSPRSPASYRSPPGSENSSTFSSPRSNPGSKPSSPQKPSPTSPGLSAPLSCMSLLVEQPAGAPAAKRKLFTLDEVPPLRAISSNRQESLLLLQSTAEKIITLAMPLHPKQGDHTTDVYLFPPPSPRGKTNPHAVFKPGAPNAERAILCNDTATILGVEASVPLAIRAEASSAYCKEDFTLDLQPKDYEVMTINGEKWLVAPEDCYEILDITDDIVTLDDNCVFTYIEQKNGIYLDPKENPLAQEHELAHEAVLLTDDLSCIVRCEAWARVNKDDAGLHVIRDGRRSQLTRSQNECHLNREYLTDDEHRDIQGMFPDDEEDNLSGSTDVDDFRGPVNLVSMGVKGVLMQMVPNVVTKINGKAVDIEKATPERKIFFDMINPISFINSVILAILFRPQDGKAGGLDETNFLFSEEDGKLNLTVIDPDETWPTGNGLSEDPELAAKGDIAALRLGLMGYPLAYELLDPDAKAHLCGLLAQIKINREELVETLVMAQENDKEHLGRADIKDKIMAAYEEVLDKLIEFYDTRKKSDFVIEDLVFPRLSIYAAQWKVLC